MSIDAYGELRDFHRFVTERLGNGGVGLSPEEALDLWRAEHPSDREFASTVVALEEALDDMAAGDAGTPLEEFDRDFRRKHRAPPRT